MELIADGVHLHPAVLRVMNMIAQSVRASGKRLSICGEMAGNPGAAMRLPWVPHRETQASGCGGGASRLTH